MDNPKRRKKWDSKHYSKNEPYERYYRRRKKIKAIFSKIAKGKKLSKTERKLLSKYLRRKR